MAKMGRTAQCISLILGGAIGTFCFLLLGAFLLGAPIKDTILSAHGVLAATKATPLTSEQSRLVAELVEKGALISSTDLIASMSAFYSTIIQVLIATFFVFGVLSFFAVQAHSRRQVEDLSEDMVGKTTRRFFGSVEFDNLLRTKIDSTLEIELEAYEGRIAAGEKASERVDEIENRISELVQKTRKTEDE